MKKKPFLTKWLGVVFSSNIHLWGPHLVFAPLTEKCLFSTPQLSERQLGSELDEPCKQSQVLGQAVGQSASGRESRMRAEEGRSGLCWGPGRPRGLRVLLLALQLQRART